MVADSNLHLEGGPLVVPTIPSGGNSSPWVPGFLRSKLWPADVPKPEKYIHVSRSKAPTRRLKDEHDFLPVFSRWGFETICLEDLSFRNQIELFASAKVTCGIHGSGLTNVFFQQPGTRMLEIFDPEFPEACWHTFASLSEVDFYYLLGEGPKCDVADLSKFDSLNHRDIICDAKKLEAGLSMVISGGHPIPR